MARRMYALSFSPREFSISRRIPSNATASASRSASSKCAYSTTFVIAIGVSSTSSRGRPQPFWLVDGHGGEIPLRQVHYHVLLGGVFRTAPDEASERERRRRGSQAGQPTH